MDSESLGDKWLVDYDVTVAMESRHRDYVLILCPEFGDKVVWFEMLKTHTLWIEKKLGKCMSRLKRKLQNWLSRSEVPKWAWFAGRV